MKGNWSRSASFKWTKIKKRNILQAILGRERRINACECFKKVDWIKQIDFGYLHIKTSNQTSIQKYTVINCYLYLYFITVSSNHQQTANRSQDASSQYTWLQTQIAYSSNAPNPAASEADIPSCMRDVTGFFSSESLGELSTAGSNIWSLPECFCRPPWWLAFLLFWRNTSAANRKTLYTRAGQ